MSELKHPGTIARTLAIVGVVMVAIGPPMPVAAQSQPSPPAPKTVIIQVTPAPVAPLAPAAVPVVPDQPVPLPPRENPGLINEIGKMFSAPTWSIPSLPALPSLTLPLDSNEALPKLQTMVKGRMVCPVAANGAPDCKIGSDKLCQSKGFKEGKSLDTDSAVSCSAKSMMGAKTVEDVCKTENYVTRAMCQ